MVITEEIRNIIKEAVEITGSPYQLSLKLGNIRHTTIRDWLSGKTKSISDRNWEIVRDILYDIVIDNHKCDPFDDDYYELDICEKMELDEIYNKLTPLELKRLYLCLKPAFDLKENNPKLEIELTFSVTIKSSIDGKYVDTIYDPDGIICANWPEEELHR